MTLEGCLRHWNIAHDAMTDHGMQKLSEALCAYATAIVGPMCRQV